MTRTEPTDRRPLARYAWLSIAAAVLTMGLKAAAYGVTGSVGLLSDALESIVNLAAALMTLAMLHLAARPPDEEHAYGHDKAEYFASAVEGTLILLAAGAIGWASAGRLLSPRAIEDVGLGLLISSAAAAVNLGAAAVLLHAGRAHHSIALEADGHHLMTDVWTSAGVLAGVAAVKLTGWLVLDPLVAIAVAAQIAWAGLRIVRRSALGLLDTALPPAEQEALRRVLERHAAAPARFHAVRTRQASSRRFVSLHVLVPGDWSVLRGHELLERIEADIRAAIPNVTVDTHLEPIEDPASFEDQGLDRPHGAAEVNEQRVTPR
jgi:cation diffusion facilitator family transporter